MKQRFALVAPRAKKVSWFSDLEEALFEGGGPDVVRLLAIPVRPQKLPSASDIAASTISSPPPQNEHHAVESPASVWSQETQERNHLKRKADGEENVGSSLPQQRAKTKLSDANDEANINSITFLNLPVELLRLIFNRIARIEDVVCLGLASRYFWAIARDYVHEHYASFFGQWAGEHIVNVGDDVLPGDYPPGLFSKEEMNELNERITTIPISDEEDEEDEDDDMDYVMMPFRLYHFSLSCVSSQHEDTNLSEASISLYVECRNRRKFKYDPAFKSTLREIVAEEITYFPQEQPWILRNSTTREFVRSEAIALSPEFIHGPFIDVLGFGEVILSRICWSKRPCPGVESAIPIHRGVWAGHKFDITTLAAHRLGTIETEWSDVSEEVASEIAKIWKSQYGSNWREIICGRFFDGGDAS
ncbi:hypothetical protein GGI35DRAFT_431942 [Trichoderma velutinum]